MLMENMIEKIGEAAAYLRSIGFADAKTAIVLGTGLGSLTSKMNIEQQVAYTKIPHFVSSTVEFHKGQLLTGTVGDHKIIVMQGRFHYYEGYSMQEITFPIRVMKALGISQLLLSNAAGGMNKLFSKGDLVLINDHINLLPENPLRGVNDPAFGNRFVDMCDPYDTVLSDQLQFSAQSLNIKLHKGVYVAVPGPNLETRAEYRYLANAGADMVGMSTVPEVIVANHIQLPCAAISVITDECDPDHLMPVNIAEILAVAAKADEKLSNLFVTFLQNN